MKKQSILSLVIVAVIISAAFFVMASTRSGEATYSKEECRDDKPCEEPVQSEFFLQSLTRSLLSR
jgi:hypothetical protein